MTKFIQGEYITSDQYGQMKNEFINSYIDDYYNDNDLEESENSGEGNKMIFENFIDDDMDDDMTEQVEIIISENTEGEETYFVDYVM